MSLLLVVSLAVGCSGAKDASTSAGDQATPTVAAYFAHSKNGAAATAEAALAATPAITPTVAVFFRHDSAVQSQLIPTLRAAAGQLSGNAALTPRPTRALPAGNRIVEVPIYNEDLDPNWTLDNSQGMKYDLKDTSRPVSGTVDLAVTPQQDYGTLLFAVKEGSARTFPYEQVVGVSFQLNSGDDALNPDDLAITILGSNDYTYWVKDDKSVPVNDQQFFSESRLYYLQINKPIPPKTWIPIEILLDNLPYDPNYKYITAVYVKNNAGFLRTVYIDALSVLVVGK